VGLWSRILEKISWLEREGPRNFGPGNFLGWVVLALFLLQALTGILLMVYYHPTTEEAYTSVRYILNTARLGWLVYGLHYWGAHLLIGATVLHLLRVLLQGAFRGRGLNWAVGLILLLMLLAFGFTGMLLPWDQAAFWTADSARRAVVQLPLFGPILLDLLWGGLELGEGALLRFYVFHVGILPWIGLSLTVFHLYLVRRQGLYAGTSARTYADLLLDGLILGLLLLGVLVTLAVLFAPPPGPPADPLKPASAKPPWYLLPFFQLFTSPGWGFLVLFCLFALILALPWLGKLRSPTVILIPLSLGVWGLEAEGAEEKCLICHSEVKVDYLESSHSSAGVTCTSCHGGDPATLELDAAHDPQAGFRGPLTRAEIPQHCASCHSDPQKMKPYSLHTDQYAEYLTSTHGKRWMAGDLKVAVCTDCHSAHLILPAYEPRSSVNPANLPETCARCHSDETLMAPYGLPTDQAEAFLGDVHGRALLEEGNPRAPSCAACHGAHGAAPPGVEEVSMVCGVCHINEQRYFAAGPHKRAMDELGIPECAGCHRNHGIEPTDVAGLFDTVCADCHASDSPALTVGQKLKVLLIGAQQALLEAETALSEAEALGYEVEPYRSRIIEAHAYLIEAQPVQHSLDVTRVEELTRRARSIAEEVRSQVHGLLGGRSIRLVGLAIFWIYLMLTILVALIYRRERRREVE
jgi:quinol-cytochrome oxidoreductase complex cytochrome b subunit